MNNQTTHIKATWKEDFADWLTNNLQITSKSNVELIVKHVEHYYVSPSTPSEQGSDGWISVKDGLPDFDVNVLVMGEAKGMNPQMGGAYAFITKRQDFSKLKHLREYERLLDENKFRAAYVTHWRYLPKKPTPPQSNQ